jgi:hypothetical protein
MRLRKTRVYQRATLQGARNSYEIVPPNSHSHHLIGHLLEAMEGLLQHRIFSTLPVNLSDGQASRRVELLAVT